MQLLYVAGAERDGDGGGIAKVQRAEVELPARGRGVDVFLEDILCERALQGDEALARKDGVAHVGAGAGGVEVREGVGQVVVVFAQAGGVCDDVDGGGVLDGDDEVVDDATGDGVQEDRERGLVGLEDGQVCGGDGLQELEGAGTFEAGGEAAAAEGGVC